MGEERCRERAVVEQDAGSGDRGAVRSRKWANHRAYDRLPGRPLGPSGENVAGKAPQGVVSRAARVNGSVECGRRARQAGQEEEKGGLWRVN